MLAKNNQVQEILGGKHYDLPVSGQVRQGSLVFWDATNKVAKEAATDADCASLLGVSLSTYPPTSNIDNGVVNAPATINAGYWGIFEFQTTTGDTYENFTPVYIGADAQTVTSNNSGKTNDIGYVRLPSGVASLAGGSGVKVPVFVYSKK